MGILTLYKLNFRMKSKKTITKKDGVTAFTWFLFSVFLVVSFVCIKFIKEIESQHEVASYVPPTTVVKSPSKSPVQRVTPKTIKK